MTAVNAAGLGRRTDDVGGDAGRRPLAGRGAGRGAEASFAVLYSSVPMCAFTPLSEHRLMIRP